MHICNQPGCNKPFKKPSDLKQHKAHVHDIDVVWFECDQPECNYKCKKASNIKQHKADIHDIDVVWHNCNQPGCDEKFKKESSLKRHKALIHGVDIQWFYCDQVNCNFKCKTANNLKTHRSSIHNINVIWHHCDQPQCDYKAKTASALKTHESSFHNIGVTWHICTQHDCDSKFKQACHLKAHLEGTHDVGDHPCDYCCYNRNTSIEYFCPKWAITSQICRGCHDTVTGKKVRKETEWSNYIDEHFGTEYLLLSDKSLASVGGCIRERPDKLHTSPDLVILSECDEFEHMYKNGAYTCEEERVSKIYDEAGICGKTMVVIRWNPDGYQLPEGGSYKKLKKAERLELHVAVMNFILAHPEVIQGKVHVFYLLFSPDNPKIARHYPVSMIYNKSDLAVDENGQAQVNTVMPVQLL